MNEEVDYEYFLFRFLPNIVADEFKNIGLYLRRATLANEPPSQSEKRVGIAFVVDFDHIAELFGTDELDETVLKAFAEEAITKFKTADLAPTSKVFDEWLQVVSESNSGIIVEGPIVFRSSFDDEDVFKEIFSRMVKKLPQAGSQVGSWTIVRSNRRITPC